MAPQRGLREVWNERHWRGLEPVLAEISEILRSGDADLTEWLEIQSEDTATNQKGKQDFAPKETWMTKAVAHLESRLRDPDDDFDEVFETLERVLSKSITPSIRRQLEDVITKLAPMNAQSANQDCVRPNAGNFFSVHVEFSERGIFFRVFGSMLLLACKRGGEKRTRSIVVLERKVPANCKARGVPGGKKGSLSPPSDASHGGNLSSGADGDALRRVLSNPTIEEFLLPEKLEQHGKQNGALHMSFDGDKKPQALSRLIGKELLLREGIVQRGKLNFALLKSFELTLQALVQRGGDSGPGPEDNMGRRSASKHSFESILCLGGNDVLRRTRQGLQRFCSHGGDMSMETCVLCKRRQPLQRQLVSNVIIVVC
ncbi:Hypothetical Protein FCC1311_037602 [Hondaea fermentalgiana]|uniref:Uncharacterized protein n=1 Tax=Hondaea fermentalgiana TaxID=2315210 RepID=A0A2R5G913_9STRA|nr:Hypothetical Protein FCC1311_037602 [Hondaea fermentalgiana]|eukprot:GBG27537.1 Hypothetical Protein FCC1311_037602 [Hondaea fermentalgiana]